MANENAGERPLLGRKIAHYYFSDGHELVLYVRARRLAIREPDGRFPVCPERHECGPHPAEEEFDASIPAYDELGLYYNYAMAGTGWDGDC